MADTPTTLLKEKEIDNLFLGARANVAFDVANSNLVRRPLRGIRLKQESFASLSVNGPGKKPHIANSSAPKTQADFEPGELLDLDLPDQIINYTSNFIIQSLVEQRQEKFQPITTFGAPYGYFFGEQPRMIQCTAVLLNTADFQWEVEWWHNYEQYFRGTRLANRGLRAFLSYDDTIIEGYLTSASTSKRASDPYQVDLSFSMWVTNVTYLITAGDKAIDTRHDLANSSESLGLREVSTDQGRSTTTADVRARNITALSRRGGTGLLSALRDSLLNANDLSSYTGLAGNVIGNVVDFLYGRNLVIPAGFAGSELQGGTAIFASGSGFGSLEGVDLTRQLNGSSLNVSVPGKITGHVHLRGTFYDNEDEYPARRSGMSREYIDVALSLNFGSGLSGTTRDERHREYIELAESSFEKFGINIRNQTGKSSSDLLRTLGRASFAALSYAAMTTGASQAAASLVVTGGTTQGVGAAQESQGVLEDLGVLDALGGGA
jgi:hypothetical protein